ncbi:MAG: TonB-dependent receptor [Bacteroidales bacterium]
MRYHRPLHKGFFVFLFLFFTATRFPGFAQVAPATKPVSELIEQWQQQNGVQIFFQLTWLDEAGLDPLPAQSSLDDFLEMLDASPALSYYRRGLLIVVLPALGRRDGEVRITDNRIYIGDPADLGRYTRARIEGVVYDGQTRTPLPGATVSFENTNIAATTDRQGRFSFLLPAGELKVRVSYIGFQDLHRELYVFSGGNLELELFEDFVQLEGVTVSARRMGDKVSGTRMSMISMDSRTVRELPVSFGESDIIRSFTLKPGVQSVGEFGSGFNVRGGSADQNLILLEGVPLFNSSHLFGLSSVVNSDMISRVDLMKAGIPARFGERVSSVMDIRMSQEEPQEARISGGLGLLNSRLQVQTPLLGDALSVSLSGRSSYSNWFLENMPDNDLMNSEAGFFDLAAVVNFRPAANQFISLFAYRSEDQFTMAANSAYQYASQLGSLRWTGFLAEKLRSEVLLGFSDYHYQVRENLVTNQRNGYMLSSAIAYRNARWNLNWYPSTTHSLESGVSAVFYQISPGEIQPEGDPSLVLPKTLQQEQAMEFAAWLSDNISISGRLDLEVGLRYSLYHQTGPGEVWLYEQGKPRSLLNRTDTLFFGRGETIARYHGLEPRVALRYGLDELSSLKISYNRINQYINQLSNTAVANPSDIWKLSDRHLKPLRSDQFALGYFRNIPANRLEVSAEVYFKRLHNMVEYKNGAQLLMNEAIETDLVNASGYSYGAELALEKHEGRLNGWVSYAFSLSRIRTQEPFAEGQINRNQYFPSNHEQPHNFVLNTNYRISRRWRFNTTFVYATGRPVTLPELVYNYNQSQVIFFSDRNAYRMPDYHRLDLAITFDESLKRKKSWKGSWTLSVVNLYARKNAYSIFYQKDKPHAGNDFRHYSLYKMYIIGRPLPTLTYNFVF